MTLSDRMGIYSARWTVTLVSMVISLVNGISWSIAWLLILFGVVIDLNRYRFKRKSERFVFIFGLCIFPVRLGFRPMYIGYLLGFTSLSLIALYFILPEQTCWPALNSWIETNIRIIHWRMVSFPQICEVSRGSFLLLSQAALPVIVLISAGMTFSVARFDPRLFLNEIPWFLRLRTTHEAENCNNGMRWRSYLHFIVVVSIIIFILHIAPFTLHARGKSLPVHESGLAFALWVFVMMMPSALVCFLAQAEMRAVQKEYSSR